MDESRPFEIFDNATEKQLEALELAAEGLTSKQVAQRLNVAPRTIDQRIDTIRKHLGGLPRNDAVRLFRQWRAMCDPTTHDPIPVTGLQDGRAKGAARKEADLVFKDAALIDGRAPWDRPAFRMLPGFGPSDLGTFGKLIAVGVVALFLLVSFSLIVMSAQGIDALFSPSG